MSMMLLSMKSYTTLVLSMTVFFLFADQNVLAPNLSAIAKEFGFNDEERDEYLGGYVAFGFFIVGGPVALMVGYLTDTVHRCRLFGLVVGFGACASMSTYWIKTYPELLLCRVLTGISIGGATPIIFSLLGDLYPGSSRIYVSTMIGVSMGSGVAGGQLISGMVGPALGWRVPFLLVATPAILCALLVFFTVDEPRRGDQEHAVRQFREHRTTMKSTSLMYQFRHDASNTHLPSDIPTVSPLHGHQSGAVTNPSSTHGGNSGGTYARPPSDRNNPLLDLSLVTIDTLSEVRENVIEEDGANSAVIHNRVVSEEDEVDYSEKIECSKVLKLLQTPTVLLIFIQGFPGCLPWGMIIVFLNDFLSNDKGMSVEAATAVLTCFGIGGLFGQFFGGWFGQRLYNRDPRWQCVFMGTSTMLSVPPILYILNAEIVGDAGFYFMAILGGFLVNMNGPNVRVVLQNVCIPEIRGTAFAFFTLTDDIGKGLGPALVVLLIQACGGERREAFNIVVLFWVFCGCLLLMLTITVAEDERKAQDQIKESLMKRVNTMTAASMQSRLQSYQNPGIQVPCSGGVGTLGILDSNGYNPSQYSPKYETTYAQFVDENIVANVKRNKSGKIVSTTNIDTRASQITTSSHISINPMMNFEHTHVIRYGIQDEVPEAEANSLNTSCLATTTAAAYPVEGSIK